MREAVSAPLLVAGDRLLEEHAVIVEEGRIIDVLRLAEVASTIPVRRFAEGVLTPGLVDIHVHGAGGSGFADGDSEAFTRALAAILDAGVTSVLPTLVSAPLPSLRAALEVVQRLPGRGDLPRLPGVHLEGPYFSAAQSGAQDRAALRVPNDGSVDQLLEHRDVIRMMSFAPELDGAVDLTTRLVGEGIVAAAGHSDCTDEELLRCQRAGLSHIIHIYSGQSTTTRRGPWRQPGLLEASLASESLTVEMIADGRHLPATLMTLAHRAVGDRLCVVSDASPGAGLPDGSRYRMGDVEYVVHEGVGMTVDGLSFAGSTTLVNRMIPVLLSLGIGLAAAIGMVTSIPARAARLDDVGSIAPGMRADLVLFDEEFTPVDVALGGRWRSASSAKA